jgi:hypothetical protein
MSSYSTHIWNVVEIGQCWICAVLWWPFWKWRQLEIFQCQGSIRDIIWVDNNVPNWFPTLKNVYQSPFSKWPPQYRTNSTLSDFNDISYIGRLWYPEFIMKSRWNRTMLNLCGIVAAILKMATSRHFSMSGINSGHHYVPTYQILTILDNVEFLR